MSYNLARGETVSLNSLASHTHAYRESWYQGQRCWHCQSVKNTQPVILSNSERVHKLNDLTALHTIMKVRGV